MSLDYVSNQEIVQAARRNLSQDVWDYLVGGSESETTMRRNRLGFDRLAFRPRVLVDVSKVDSSTSFLGHRLRIPVLLAPVGGLQRFTPQGAVASAKAAAEFGTMHVVSSVTEPGIEETAASTERPKAFQLYIQGDWDWVKERLARVKNAGYVALCITADNAHYSRRERVLLGGGPSPARRLAEGPRYGAAVTWEMIDTIKATVGLPMMIKGIATAEDAALAIEHGAEVIWVSNHGGRQLDHGRGTIEMLPEIVQAVEGKAEIVLDGGIQRGSDVLKAIALGANAVAIGKLQGWGLAAAGNDGLVRVLEILEEEIVCAMGLLGVTCLDQLGPTYLCETEPVTLPHEMSAWVNILGGGCPRRRGTKR